MNEQQLCKVLDCGRPEAWSHGMYAGLCKEHAEAKKRQRQLEQKTATENGHVPLAELAERVDTARDAYRQAWDELHAAMRERQP